MRDGLLADLEGGTMGNWLKLDLARVERAAEAVYNRLHARAAIDRPWPELCRQALHSEDACGTKAECETLARAALEGYARRPERRRAR